MTPATSWKKNFLSPSPTAYLVSFEDYLKPQSVLNQKSLILDNKKQQKPILRLKLLEHPVLIAGQKSKYLRVKENVGKKLTNLQKTFSKLCLSHFKLHRFLAFLLARNDLNTCKRKSGFEIYCEIASIHGFNNFVGATTLQRVFWFLVVLMAVVMSGSVLLVSHFMNVQTPTILYSESTQYPTSSMPFPGVTICNLNRISKIKAENLAKRFQRTSNVTINELTNYFKLALYTSENIMADSRDFENFNKILKQNNYTIHQVRQEISPNCENDLLKCKFKGNLERCSHLFRKTQTSFGLCCSLYHIDLNKVQSTSKLSNCDTSGCGYKNGLTILLDPQLQDYKASSFLTPGFQVLLHTVDNFVDEGTEQFIITTTTSNKIRVWPHQTYATEHISSLKIHVRKCYLPNERVLFHFGSYSQEKCLAECRSLMFYEKCHCALPFRPKMQNWTVCGLDDRKCYFKYKSLLYSTLKSSNTQFNGEQIVCDCYPLCAYNSYFLSMDSGELSRKFALTGKRFYRSINITDHILLRVFVADLQAERLRLDVSENWLSFLGTFGGITGLYMGYSILSGFELIFFVIVRPACNWWTKKRIQRRLKNQSNSGQL